MGVAFTLKTNYFIMEWTGFSDEDLRRLKTNSTDGRAETSTKLQTSRLRSDDSRKTSRQKKPSKVVTFAEDGKTEPLSTDQRSKLPQQTEKDSPQTDKQGRLNSSSLSVKEVNKTNAMVTADLNALENGALGPKQCAGTDASGEITVPEVVAGKTANQTDVPEFSIDLDEKSILTRELGTLEKFRDQQKMIEELNRRKKQMLSTAIQQRQRKAKAEAVKLTKIKQELDHLDQLLSADVSIIRNKIETASREYTEAQKRYDRAELEFIEAKTDLHRKCESKDLLTEHLYTVIHQNELRKSNKLAELMRQLELETTDVCEGELSSADVLPVPLCLTMPSVRSSVQHLGLPSPSTPPPVTDGGVCGAAMINSCAEHRSLEDSCTKVVSVSNSIDSGIAISAETSSTDDPTKT